MTEIEITLQKTENKLLDLYLRANTKSKRKILARDLITFSHICRERFELDKVFEWEKDVKILSLLNNHKIPFIKNILCDNSITYNNIFTSVLNSFIENNYQIYNYYNKNYSRLTHKEMQELIFDFLNNYDYDLLDTFRKKINNMELFYGNLVDVRGATYSIGCLNKNLMFYTPTYGESIDSASTIVHEFGHSYEMNVFYSVGRKNYFDIVWSGPYYEITPRFFEFAFLSYLKENNVHVDDVNMRLDNILFDLLMRAYDINLI